MTLPVEMRVFQPTFVEQRERFKKEFLKRKLLLKLEA